MQAAQKKAAKQLANRRCIEGGEFEELSFGRPDPIGNDGVAMRIEVGPIRTWDGCASPHGDYVSRSVSSTAGHRFSKSPSRWSPRFNRAWIRCCVSGHVSAV